MTLPSLEVGLGVSSCSGAPATGSGTGTSMTVLIVRGCSPADGDGTGRLGLGCGCGKNDGLGAPVVPGSGKFGFDDCAIAPIESPERIMPGTRMQMRANMDSIGSFSDFSFCAIAEEPETH